MRRPYAPHKFIPPVPLRIEQRGEIAVIDPRRCAVSSDATLEFDLDHGVRAATPAALFPKQTQPLRLRNRGDRRFLRLPFASSRWLDAALSDHPASGVKLRK